MKCCAMPISSFRLYKKSFVGPDVIRAKASFCTIMPKAALPRIKSRATWCLAVALLSSPALAKKQPVPDFAPVPPVENVAPPTPGAIFGAGYAPLTSGARASQVGDVLTVVLVERMQATKSNSAQTGRDGKIGLAPPTTGLLALFKPTDVNMGGGSSFTGKGAAEQSNALSGELSVTVIAVRANGTMLVRGEKALTLNRGDEFVQLSGIVRAADIAPDNRVPSTRIADAKITYTGKGEIARASRQGWLQRFFSAVSPF